MRAMGLPFDWYLPGVRQQKYDRSASDMGSQNREWYICLPLVTVSVTKDMLRRKGVLIRGIGHVDVMLPLRIQHPQH